MAAGIDLALALVEEDIGRCDDAAGETCPVWPGQAQTRLAFADTMRMLTNRINMFVSLPLRSLDQLSLQRQLDAIGKAKDGKPASAA